MINNSLTVTVGSAIHKIFLQAGFYDLQPPCDRMHVHPYTEVHVILDGGATFSVNEIHYVLSAGDMLVIPGGAYHASVDIHSAVHTAFQIDAHCDSTQLFSLDRSLVTCLEREIIACRSSGDHTGIAAYTSLLCRHFLPLERASAQRISDYAFLIGEFFSNNYSRDVHLCDLAGDLHLSERQTERLVIESTGMSFRRKLISVRLAMAEHLQKHSNMSLQEIAEYVGYRSYAGFWKAMKKI